ncbi:hypothetical protein [Corynebacterium rhinophilum]|uniref:hypothetical protein n=1 Tax=Corynebacterium rhinophilum TaxID=3050197 RepID=UPI00254D7643|nr:MULTISPECIES: hypothetical protein [unclassified Corynebacterium]MDK8467293.1 hypothetical protein [Corynebacterium sp. MSK130]MDK8687696.1 hypothetical protein [Corynebacterium sp. MSK122]
MSPDKTGPLNHNEPSEMETARQLRDDKRSEPTSAAEENSPKTKKPSAPELENTAPDSDYLQDADGLTSDYDDDTSTEAQLNAVKLRREKTYLKNQQQNLDLRRKIAGHSTWAVAIQMVLTNLIFIIYMFAVSFRPESEVMIAWMSSTVVQIVGIALVVAKGIFPQRSGSRMQDEEGDIS